MLAFLKSRTFLVIVGLVLLSLLIWFAGPYFAFADHKPLESVVARLVTILVIVVIWAVTLQVRQARAGRANRELAAGVVAQEEGAASQRDGAPVAADRDGAPADAAQLRKRFEEAIEELKKSRGKGATDLYRLPWYVIIGPPGSGKTTVLVNSGLNFPLARKFGKEALRGVGGTRNCDWWFTDKAILLDTAGRYTTQDSNSRADAAGWVAFLQLLRKFRGRQPINGVIVAMSASDLLTCAEPERERHVTAIRERLDEISRTLGIHVPVYFLVTKCDLVAGFSEFFEELGQEARAQVWGTTFPIEATESGRAAELFASEFERLLERLQQRVFTRLEAERDARRRVGILAFPQQMAALGPLLSELVKRVFTSTDFDSRILLRGVYFTSGTQEGTPIDRMLGAIARTFGVTSAVAPVPVGRGKSFFIERLLKHVIFQESGLAGINRRLQLRTIAVKAGAYVLCAVILVLGLLGLTVSYDANASYIDEVADAAKNLDSTRLGPGAAALPPAALLPRLDALRSISMSAGKYESHTPWRMRMGLYSGKALGEAAHDAYLRELNGLLLPVIAARFADEVRGSVATPDRLYEYLKGYLMLGDARHRDAGDLQVLSDVELLQMYPRDADTKQRLATHFGQLLTTRDAMSSVPLNAELVQQGRNALRTASLPVLMYSRLKLAHAGDTKHALRVDLAAGPGADRVLVRASGIPLSDPVPALYTKAVFREVNTTGKLEVLTQFASDGWVFGGNLLDASNSGAQVYEMLKLYEQDYIRTWDAVVKDVRIRPTTDSSDLAELLGVLSSPASPLKGYLVAVAQNTDLSPDAAAAGLPAPAAGLLAKASQLSQLVGAPPAGADAPGTAVSAHFESIRNLVQGPAGAAPIDAVLASLGQTRQQLRSLGSGLGGASALDTLAKSGQGEALKSLQTQAKQLPPPIGDMVAQIGVRSASLTVGQARGELQRRYDEQVLRECRELIDGRYPFVAASPNDVPLADFGRVFGFGGVFDTFYRDNLAALIDVSRSPWVWREGAAAIGGSAALLKQFQQAQRIRDVYFKPGSQQVEARFNLTPDTLDAAATRFTLNIDGQLFEYRHGPLQSQALTWPGGSVGQAAIAFEERGGPGPGEAKQGPWAWFRELDRAQVKRDSDTRLRVTFLAGQRSMSVVLEAASIRNPFVRNELAGFRCSM
jgi:type VI secretion system protein ImpL